MQTQPIPSALPQFPMQELEQVEFAIQVSQQWLAVLQGRRDSLTAELERITRPQFITPKPTTRTILPGLEYRGVMTPHWRYIDTHIDLLSRLWTEFPDRREAMAKAVGRYGTTRAYVAKTREELFPGQSHAWARRYSRILVDGWYVDTNLNRERMSRILPAAVEAAGLRWSKDVKAYWRRTQVPNLSTVEVFSVSPMQAEKTTH